MDDGWVDGAYGGCGGTGKGGKGDLQSNKNDKYSIVVYTHYSIVQFSSAQLSSAQLGVISGGVKKRRLSYFAWDASPTQPTIGLRNRPTYHHTTRRLPDHCPLLRRSCTGTSRRFRRSGSWPPIFDTTGNQSQSRGRGCYRPAVVIFARPRHARSDPTNRRMGGKARPGRERNATSNVSLLCTVHYTILTGIWYWYCTVLYK